MSGSTGANRIKRVDVQPTVDKYLKDVLNNFEGFKDYQISGSYNGTDKDDFGDIDIIILIEGYKDKPEAKRAFKKYIEDNNLSLPFRGDNKYNGKLANNTGEIITIAYPQVGNELDVQIDNIFAINQEEFDFKFNFLNIPAENQGLALGLSKVIIQEDESLRDTFQELIDALEDNHEVEFSLSSQNLDIRIQTLDENYKTTNTIVVQKFNDWKYVKDLFKEYLDFDKPFEENLKTISEKITSERSRKRIEGVFHSMISVKSGELDTPKGEKKQAALDQVKEVLLNSKKPKDKIVAIYGGRFQPPSEHHIEVYNKAKLKYDQVYIATSNKVEEDKSPFDFETKKQVFELLGVPSDDIILTKSPYQPKEIYDLLDKNTKVVFILGEKDSDRFKGSNYFSDVSNIDSTKLYVGEGAYLDSSISILEDDGKMSSATAIRKLIKNKEVDILKEYFNEEIIEILLRDA